MRSSDNSSDLTVTPLRSYKINNQLCRDFETQLKEQGKISYEKASACKNDEGTWQIKA
jgi:surface antigen